MVLSRDVKKVVLLKDEELVEITLKSEALQNAKYKQELERNSSPLGGLNTNGPHYKMKIGSVDQFDRYYKELSERVPRDQRVNVKYEKSNDITGVLVQWGLLFLLLFGFWMLMRRMTGGGGPGGQIFNIGKSKAALFDAESKVKITFDPGVPLCRVTVFALVEL